MKKTKIPASMKGKYVTRAAFAKLQAENHRMKKDIYIMVMGSIPECVFVKEKYRKEFDFWNDIKSELKKLAKKELPKLRKQFNLDKSHSGKLDSAKGASQ